MGNKSAKSASFWHFRVNIGTYVHKAMYSVQNRPREGELVVNGMKVPLRRLGSI